jgi:uncharacterized protein
MALDASAYLVEVSGDKMQATLSLLVDLPAAALSADDLMAALASKGVTHGIDAGMLQRVIRNPAKNIPFTVAKGQASVDGQPEAIEFRFDTGGQSLPDDEAGSVDFRSIKNFNNTRAGVIVAIKKPATEGNSGFDVLGNEYKPREGKKATLRVGKGVTLSEDGMTAIAEIDGHACVMGDRITVLGTIDIPANVDYSIGNISFVGNVRIRGGVMPGFSVSTEGSIEIAGNVEKATIQCGGNLDIRGLVFGQGACLLEVAGDASIGAVDQATLNIRGDLHVANYIRHCKVAVGGKIEVSGKKGNIVGGELAAFRGIQAPFIGNGMATLTKLTVGSNPFVSSELTEVSNRQTELESKLTQINTALSAVHERQARSGGMDPASQLLIEKLRKAKEAIEPELVSVTAQVATLQEQTSEFKEARIRISDIVYPGVVINFRDRLQYKTMDEAQHLCFYEEAAEIRTGPF